MRVYKYRCICEVQLTAYLMKMRMIPREVYAPGAEERGSVKREAIQSVSRVFIRSKEDASTKNRLQQAQEDRRHKRDKKRRNKAIRKIKRQNKSRRECPRTQDRFQTQPKDKAERLAPAIRCYTASMGTHTYKRTHAHRK